MQQAGVIHSQDTNAAIICFENMRYENKSKIIMRPLTPK